jgi:hypothetical protein
MSTGDKIAAVVGVLIGVYMAALVLIHIRTLDGRGPRR